MGAPRSDFLKRMKDMRQHINQNGSILLVQCPTNRRMEVLDLISYHTDSIIVLEMFNVKALESTYLKDITRLIMDKNTPLDVVSSFLDSEEYFHLLNNEPELETEPTTAFLFKVGNIRYKNKSISIESLMRQVPSQFGLAGYFQGPGEKKYLLYRELKRYRPLNKTLKPVAVTTWGGYGDAVMMYQQIQMFVNRERKKGREVHVITPYFKMYDIFKDFLKNCYLFHIDIIVNKRLNETLLHSGYYERIYNLALLTPQEVPYKHVLDLWSSCLGYEEPSPLLGHTEMPLLQEKVRQIIEEQRQAGKKIIGFQFCTEDQEKSWPIEHAIEFLNQCKKHNLCVLSLAPQHCGELDGIIDVGFLKVSELFPLIAELDMVVGIDSCCCHIAGVLGVPNLTIWGDSYPHQYRPLRDTRYLSYRSLRMNYSIASKDADPASISSKLVFRRSYEILDGNITLQKTRLTIEDTLNSVGVEWVGD